MKPKIPRKPVVEAVSDDAHHHRFGAAPIFGIGHPDEGSGFVVIFKETIRNGKLAWKKMGEARYSRIGMMGATLYGGPWALPASAADALAEELNQLPDSVWR